MAKESGLKLTETLRRAVSRSCPSGNTAFYWNSPSDKDSLVLSLLTSFDEDGNPGWDTKEQKPIFCAYLIFYHDPAEKALKTLRFGIDATTVAIPLKPAEVRAKIASLESRTLATSVEAFQLLSLEDEVPLSFWTNPARLRITQLSSRGSPITTELPFRLHSL